MENIKTTKQSENMKKWLKQFATEDWIIVFAGAVVLLLAALFPENIPSLPKKLATASDWINAGLMFLFVYLLTVVTSLFMGKKPKDLIWVLPSLLVIFVLTIAAQLTANIPVVKEYGFEAVFFSVIYGLIISNCFRVPQWLKAAVQSEFYIKIGIICLGATIYFPKLMGDGAFGLIQALVVVFTVWYFAFWIGKKMKVDPEMGTMLASAVSICGVSAAIATCGVIKGDNKKLSYVVSLVLIVAVPMMYLLPWLAGLLGLTPDVAGAWIGGTIDTTGAVGAAGELVGDGAEDIAVVVKSAQNVLLGVAAFFISLMWAYQGTHKDERPTAGVIWERFPKFVLGMVISSLVFSFCFEPATASLLGKTAKALQGSFFSIAFVCIGLETRFKDIFGKENRVPLKVFLTAQTFNIFVTLLVAYLVFGLLKPWILGM